MSKPKLDSRKPCIYVAQSATTRKFYVGQTRYGLTHRKHQHYDRAFNKLRNTKFCRALRELGWEDFFWEVIFIVEEKLEKDDLQELLNEKEKFYVEYYNSYIEGYNSDPGGGCGVRYKYSTLEEKKEALRIGQNQRRAENRDKWNTRQNQRRTENRNEWNTRQNQRRAENRKAINERQRKKRHENIEVYRAAYNERRRKRKESSSNS